MTVCTKNSFSFRSPTVDFCPRSFSVLRIVEYSKAQRLSLRSLTGDIMVGILLIFITISFLLPLSVTTYSSVSILDTIYTERYMGMPQESDNYIGYKVEYNN